MPKRLQLYVICAILVAIALRWHGVFANTFHADEALYASWSRLIATGRDVLLWKQVVDKPPLLFYGQGFFYLLMRGRIDWAGRLPNFIASIFMLPLLAQWTWRIYRKELATMIAIILVTLSPFVIQFSPTAFTDPLMVTLALTAFVCQTYQSKKAIRNAGIFLALSIATKQTALLYLPLWLGLGLLAQWGKTQWQWALKGLGSGLGVLALWEIVRGSNNTWQAMSVNYGGIRLAYSWELLPRLTEWGKLWFHVFGSSVLIVGLMLTLPFFFRLFLQKFDWQRAFDQLCLVYLAGYFFFHWFGIIPVWDRYILPAIPLVALLCGRAISRLYTTYLSSYRSLQWGIVGLMGLLMLPASMQARKGVFPIGGQPIADLGAAQIADYLQDYPYGTVLYDQYFGWHWRYYLFDETVYHSWFPSPEALVTDLQAFAEKSDARLLILPPDARAVPIRRALNDAGMALEKRFTAYHTNGDEAMTLYQIIVPH